MKEIKTYNKPKLKMQPDTYYVWVGASCDYAHEERASAGVISWRRMVNTLIQYIISPDL